MNLKLWAMILGLLQTLGAIVVAAIRAGAEQARQGGYKPAPPAGPPMVPAPPPPSSTQIKIQEKRQRLIQRIREAEKALQEADDLKRRLDLAEAALRECAYGEPNAAQMARSYFADRFEDPRGGDEAARDAG